MLVNRSLVSPQNLLPTGSSVCGLSPVPSHDISSLQGLACHQSAGGVQTGSSPKVSQESLPTAAASIQDSAQIPTHLQNDTESQAKRAKKSAEATKPAHQRDNFAFARVEAPATASPVLILVSFSD